MASFQCTVEKVDKYVVEFDESVCNEEWMEHFREYFYDFYSLEEHAEHIVQHITRFGFGFIEGYGIPLEDGKIPYWADKNKVNHAINIKVISNNEYVYVNED